VAYITNYLEGLSSHPQGDVRITAFAESLFVRGKRKGEKGLAN